MKKSQMTVSMPMSTYDELMGYREKYNKLLNDVLGFFNYDFAVSERRLEFKVDEAVLFCKKLLPSCYLDFPINKVETDNLIVKKNNIKNT